MAADHLQFLKDKVMADFEAAVEEMNDLPLRRHFEEVVEVLQGRSIGPCTPIGMKNGLYDLRYLLAECVLWVEQERDRRSQNKKVQLDAWHLKRLWFLRKTGKKLLRIKKELQRMKDDDAAAADFPSILSDAVRIYSVWDPSWLRGEYVCEMHGLEDKLKIIRAALLPPASSNSDGDGDVKAIGIVGMGGVGKTTLARMFVDSAARNKFSPIVWVRLSREATVHQIVTQLLQTLREPNAPPTTPLHAPLSQQLKEMQLLLWGMRYLIVLDSVWHVDAFHSNSDSDPTPSLWDAFPRGSGGAIIITSRLQDVGRSTVGATNLLKLEPTYAADKIWSMFMDSIEKKEFLGAEHRQTLWKMKDEIIYRCGGLPLAAKTLAEVISIQLAKDYRWSASTALKRVRLRIREPDPVSFANIMEKVSDFRGVHRITRSRNDEIVVACKSNIVRLARELGKYCKIELIKVDFDLYSYA